MKFPSFTYIEIPSDNAHGKINPISLHRWVATGDQETETLDSSRCPSTHALENSFDEKLKYRR